MYLEVVLTSVGSPQSRIYSSYFLLSTHPTGTLDALELGNGPGQVSTPLGYISQDQVSLVIGRHVPDGQVRR